MFFSTAFAVAVKLTVTLSGALIFWISICTLAMLPTPSPPVLSTSSTIVPASDDLTVTPAGRPSSCR